MGGLCDLGRRIRAAGKQQIRERIWQFASSNISVKEMDGDLSAKMNHGSTLNCKMQFFCI